MENAVGKILNYLQLKNVNLFSPENQKLKNLVTQELVHEDVTKQILNIFDDGLILYHKFQEERFLKKSVALSATISRNNFPSFQTVPKSLSNVTKKKM